jgi:hypothetical protein
MNLVLQLQNNKTSPVVACFEMEAECVQLEPGASYELRLAWDHDQGPQVGIAFHDEEVLVYSMTHKELWRDGVLVWKGWV